jgi:hypothetical protein
VCALRDVCEGDDARVSERQKWCQKQSAKAKYLVVINYVLESCLQLALEERKRERARVRCLAFRARRDVTTRETVYRQERIRVPSVSCLKQGRGWWSTGILQEYRGGVRVGIVGIEGE